MAYRVEWSPRAVQDLEAIAQYIAADSTAYAGSPRFVPLIIGAPRENDVELEGRGEAVLAGCISRGNDPRWVLVW